MVAGGAGVDRFASMAVSVVDRGRIVRRGQWLTAVTLAYNSIEGVLAVGAGVFSGSVALLGFGADSFIEVSASVAALWRLHADHDRARRARAEQWARVTIGVSFLALAAYVAYDAVDGLVSRKVPNESLLGIMIAVASLFVMPILARSKRGIARQLGSDALGGEARQTEVCMYLSVILLAGLGLNALLGWWWADSAAAILMAPLIAWEGTELLRGREACSDCHLVVHP